MKQQRYSTSLAIAAILLLQVYRFSALAQSDEWYYKALQLLEENKTASALFILEDSANRINESQHPVDQIERLYLLGELYQKAGKLAIAEGHYQEALRRSLELSSGWQRLENVLKVLESHYKASSTHKRLGGLLQKTLDAHLLSNSGKGIRLEQIQRYSKVMDKAISYSQLVQLLRELHEMDNAIARKKMLEGLVRIKALPDPYFSRMDKPSVHYDAEAYEKFLWQILLAKMQYKKPATAQYKESVAIAKGLIEQIPVAEQAEARKLLKQLP